MLYDIHSSWNPSARGRQSSFGEDRQPGRVSLQPSQISSLRFLTQIHFGSLALERTQFTAHAINYHGIDMVLERRKSQLNHLSY